MQANMPQLPSGNAINNAFVKQMLAR